MSAHNNGRRPKTMTMRWIDVRCRGTSSVPCNRLLFRWRYDPERIAGLDIEIRCPKCGKMTVVGHQAEPVMEDANDERERTAEQAQSV